MTARIETLNTNGKMQRRLVAYQRRSTSLSLDQWHTLDALAAQWGCVCGGGPRAGQTSWRALLRMLGDGALTVAKG